VNRYTSTIHDRQRFPRNSICDPHLVLHGRAAEASRMVIRARAAAGREPTMDTERDMTVDMDEDHIVRGLD
jgi:hypothetical protein